MNQCLQIRNKSNNINGIVEFTLITSILDNPTLQMVAGNILNIIRLFRYVGYIYTSQKIHKQQAFDHLSRAPLEIRQRTVD